MSPKRFGIARIAVALTFGYSLTVAAEQQHPGRLDDLLHRAGERVEGYFARAQSIVCLEIVRLLPLTSTWSADGTGRTVESELRLSWTPEANGGPSSEAQMLRQLLRVNGRKPRAKDHDNCTEPEQQTEEPQALSLLLPNRRAEYEFKLAGQTRVDNRAAVMVDYKLLKKVTVDSKMVEGRNDCVSFDVQGGRRGRLWIDSVNFDVLRLDESLTGMVDIPLPKKAARGPGPAHWTLERMDTSIRFRAVSFTNPDETLILPATMSSFRITHGSGTPRLRTMTDYTRYQRFLTGGRIVGE
jgi:hypothetical protein